MSDWKPLQIAYLKEGDVLEWNSSSAGIRREAVAQVSSEWIYIGPQRTSRKQDWLDNQTIKVRYSHAESK